MLVELGLVEQRYQAVLEVLAGATVIDVARRNGVARQTLHGWLRRYAASGMAGLADRSSRPATCPHQMCPEVEARILELRRVHGGWGPRSILNQLRREGVEPLPGRSSIYRALVRHRMIEPTPRRRRRADYKRWERSRSMELWQMDVMGRVRLIDGTECSVVTGIDDHSRFCVIATIVRRATARPVCDALAEGLRRHGVPDAILTDNGKVFTGRFGLGKGPVLFDRICNDNGIRHLLTAPYSPTTTGKVERLHKTMRREFFNLATFASVEETQAALDLWVETYNCERPHQGIGDVPPAERFALAARDIEPVEVLDVEEVAPEPDPSQPAGVSRWVDPAGRISLAGHRYHVGRWLAGESVEAVCRDNLVEVFHRGVAVATHAQRRPPEPKRVVSKGPARRRARPATDGLSVIRRADRNGCVCFAGASYRVGNAHALKDVTVAIVAGSVELSVDGRVVRVHPIRHDRAKEYGAFAIPKGRPRRARGVA